MKNCCLQKRCRSWGELVVLLTALASAQATAWPLDDADDTRISRLEYMRQVEAGTVKGTKQPSGALLPSAAVDLRLTDRAEMELPQPDLGFNAGLRTLLGARAENYSIAILDLTDIENPAYAEHNAEKLYNPGSVGKLIVATAWMGALKAHFGDDDAARWNLLRDTEITADDVIIRDSHTVRRWDYANNELVRRPLQVGDQGSLFEFLDWMVSPSSNAAASVLIRQAMLFNQFGDAYPLDDAAAAEFFKTTPAAEKTALLKRTLQEPIINNGFDIVSLRQGSFFTRTGKRLVSGTTSRASARELMRFLLRVEQGRVVDEFSSRIIKRLMYVTERRIRYASSPRLRDAAVYFKSGSLYKCQEEAGYTCRKYQGNVMNLMHSVAIVEAPANTRDYYYIVVLMSNVLKKNSATDHQALAAAFHDLIKARHPKPLPTPVVETTPSPAAAMPAAIEQVNETTKSSAEETTTAVKSANEIPGTSAAPADTPETAE